MKFVLFASIFSALSIFSSSQEQAISPSIVNGEEASIEEFPFLAHVFTGFYPTCGGAILSQRTVLTAAHCFPLIISQPFFVSVVVGSSYRNGRDGQSYRTSRIIYHPQYIPGPNFNDIALLRTILRIQYGELVQPIALASSDYVGVDVPGVFAGWGVYQFGPILIRWPERLQKMYTTTIANDDCRERYNHTDRGDYVIDQKLCVVSGPKTSICANDSGGPLIINGTVAGVLSWRLAPCGDGLPDVFMRISEVRDWILSALV